MNLNNLTGLEKPLCKLIDATILWLWILWNRFFEFDKRKIERIWEAETNISRLKIIRLAEADNESRLIRYEWMSKIEQLIYQKQINQETRRLKNIWDTISWAKNILESWDNSEVSDEPVDEDWSTRFFNNVQDINDEEMKKLWSKILAWEIKTPWKYSLRTLEILKNINKKEAETFIDISKFVSGNLNIITKGEYSNFLKENINFDNFSILQEIWLISPARDTVLFFLKGTHSIINFNNWIIEFNIKNNDLDIPVITLTNSWKELISLIKSNVDDIIYLQSFFLIINQVFK